MSITAAEFTLLYQRHKTLVRGAVLSYATDISEVDDIVQEVFTRAWDKRDQFRGDARAATWLHTIATSVARNWVRDKSRRPNLQSASSWSLEFEEGTDEGWLDQQSVDYDNPEELAIARQREDMIRRAADNLSPVLRQVYELHWVEECDTIQVAHRMGIPYSTATRYLSRTKEHLMKEIVR